MNLIDRDALKQALQSIKITDVLPVFPQLSYEEKARIEIVIDKYSSVIQSADLVDAEEVVRCKDCKYGDMEFEGKCYLCRANWHRDGSRRRMMPYEFCSSGKRRDDGTSQN